MEGLNARFNVVTDVTDMTAIPYSFFTWEINRGFLSYLSQVSQKYLQKFALMCFPSEMEVRP